MANTHKLKIQRIQWRAIRTCMGLMQSTHTSSCEVLAGIIPIDLRWQHNTKNLLLKSYASPNKRLQNSCNELSNCCPLHPLSKEAQDIIDLHIQSGELFPCYQHSFVESMFTPAIDWKIRNNLRSEPLTSSLNRPNEIFKEYASTVGVDLIFVFTDRSRSAAGTYGGSRLHK